MSRGRRALLLGLRFGRWPIRVRSSAIAGVVVGAALALVSGALLLLLHHTMIGAVDSAASARAEEVGAQLMHDSPHDLDRSLFATDSRVSLVQVVSASGQVLRSSDNGQLTPMVPVPAGNAQVATTGHLRVATRAVTVGSVPMFVLVGASDEAAETTLTTVAILLAAGTPVVGAVASVATGALVQRSLGSVEQIRRRVSRIDSTDLSTRVPVPQARDEIARLATTMNAMLDRIEHGHRMQRRFVGDASHELRTPLATVVAALELASVRSETLDHELLVGTLLPEAQRLQILVNDLLTLARADDAGLRYRIVDVDVDDIVAEQLRVTGEHPHLSIAATIQPARVRGDRVALTRIVRNLLDNAMIHADSVVEISVHQRPPCDEVVVTVDDDGVGVPEAERQRIFERFVRLDTERCRRTGGTGLGLAIVAELVHAHGGTVAVTRSPIGGARFIVTVPTTAAESAGPPA